MIRSKTAGAALPLAVFVVGEHCSNYVVDHKYHNKTQLVRLHLVYHLVLLHIRSHLDLNKSSLVLDLLNHHVTFTVFDTESDSHIFHQSFQTSYTKN